MMRWNLKAGKYTVVAHRTILGTVEGCWFDKTGHGNGFAIDDGTLVAQPEYPAVWPSRLVVEALRSAGIEVRDVR
jgi:hypothetical protein